MSEMFDNFNLGEALVESLEQAVAFEKGDKSKARVQVREIPVPKYTPEMIAALRERKGLTQRSLAFAVGVSPRTVEGWETGRFAPTGSSNKLLYLIDKDEDMLQRLLYIG